MINPVGGRMRPDLGPIEGTRFVGTYDSKVQGVFNLFGALLNPENIEAGNQIAVMSYHQTEDPVVPCGAKNHIMEHLLSPITIQQPMEVV